MFSKLFNRNQKVPEDQTMAILDRYLTRDFRVFPMAEEPTSQQLVLSVAKKIGVTVPPEVLAHLAGQFPGVYVEAKEDVWPRAKEFAVGPFWSFLYGVHTYTASPESEEWMRMDVVAEYLYQETGEKVLPVLKVVGDADIYCINTQSSLVRFSHELGEFEPVELGFFELFEQEVRELTERTAKKKELIASEIV